MTIVAQIGAGERFKVTKQAFGFDSLKNAISVTSTLKVYLTIHLQVTKTHSKTPEDIVKTAAPATRHEPRVPRSVFDPSAFGFDPFHNATPVTYT